MKENVKHKKEFINNLKLQNGNTEFTGMELATNDVKGIYVYEAGQDINTNYSLLLYFDDISFFYLTFRVDIRL